MPVNPVDKQMPDADYAHIDVQSESAPHYRCALTGKWRVPEEEERGEERGAPFLNYDGGFRMK